MIQAQEARKIVANAEEGLRSLMKRVIDEHRYGEVAPIAAYADGLATVLRTGGAIAAAPASQTTKPQVSHRKSAATPPPATARRKGKKSAAGTKQYPRFERDGDRLVKIGWSKTDRREYEHRAPTDIMSSVTSQLSAGVHPGKVFTMEQFMPFRDADGMEIPAYQAYLILAWLRSENLVVRRGKDGYVAQDGALNQSSISQAWNSLREG